MSVERKRGLTYEKRVFLVILFAFSFFIVACQDCFAADMDEILNYEVVVEPRMNDGSLDITYKITWKVLDSTTDGPLEWVQIGTPNSNFDNATALSKNIKSISQYNGSYVKIVFDRKYYAGEQITFKYKIHQAYMYKLSWGKCKYSFAPAWFTDIKINNMTIKWNMDSVKSSDSQLKEDNYLVWTKSNLAKGEKLNVNVKYDKNAFGYLDENKQKRNNMESSNEFKIYAIVICIIVITLIVTISLGGGGYYGHGGFYGGHHRGGCVSSCACACAGSGRAGCSKKDFYGTKISSDKLKKVLK